MAVKIKCVFPKFHYTQSNFISQKCMWQPLKTQMTCIQATAFTEPADKGSRTVIIDRDWCIKNAYINLMTLKFNFTDNLTVTLPMTSKQVY